MKRLRSASWQRTIGAVDVFADIPVTIAKALAEHGKLILVRKG
jgi:hypothetical protein